MGANEGCFRLLIDLQEEAFKGKIGVDVKEFVAFEMGRWNRRRVRTWLPLDEEREKLIIERVVGRADGMEHGST
ncbi:hypothetical protein ABW19_dt0204222 [Dactylella cylindrospora]|nr:hypothetical protein ABW19_dt0204222 [Dactylella cylindrospora]